jgi:thymidylate kinase
VTGRLIALEGPDGVGKTALAARLAQVTYEDAIAGLGSGETVMPGDAPAGVHLQAAGLADLRGTRRG